MTNQYGCLRGPYEEDSEPDKKDVGAVCAQAHGALHMDKLVNGLTRAQAAAYVALEVAVRKQHQGPRGGPGVVF